MSFPSTTTIALLLLALTPFAYSQCADPIVPISTATIAAPSLDVNNTFLREGKLNLRANWATVAGRSLQYSGIGTSGACVGSEYRPFVYDSLSPSCKSTLDGAYTFNFQEMSPACAAEFTYQNTNFYTTITFPWEIRFTDVVSSTRGATTTSFDQAHTVVLLITITFPNQVSASTADGTSPRIFSNESIAINTIITSQTVANDLPYNVSVLTQLGRSFSLDPTSVSMSSDLGYGLDDLQISVLQQDTFSASGTRTQYWVLSIVPNNSSCRFSGNYTLNFNILWAGQDDQGNPLSADQNPLGPNPTVSIFLSLESIDFCSTTIADKLTATLQTFNVAPQPGTIYQFISPSNGFFTFSRIYFQGQVTSENLALRTTSLTELFITDDDASSNRRDLVMQGLSEDDVLAYIPQSLPAAQIPGNQALFSLIADPLFFPVLQDQDQVFIFNALFTVAYQLPGNGKRDFTFGVSGSGFNPRVIQLNNKPYTSSLAMGKRSLEQLEPSTLAATTARVGLSNPRQALTSTLPASTTAQATSPQPTTEVSSSSATSTIPSLTLAFLSWFYFVY